jgi:hypothetical protein
MSPQALLEAFIVCTGKRSTADAQYAYATSGQPKIDSGGFISFQGRTIRLTGTKVSAAGSIKKIDESGAEAVCTQENANGLILESSVLVNRLYSVDNPNPYNTTGSQYPTTLVSGANIEDTTGGSFTINGLVAIMATNITILAGSAHMHGAAGALFGFSADHVATGNGVATDMLASSRQFSGNVFHRTEDTLALMGTRQQPLISSGTTAPHQLSCLASQPAQTPLTFVRPLFSSSFFATQALPAQALTFLTKGEQPIELPGGCSFREAYKYACASEKSLHEARQLPTLFSLQDMEMFYDLSHSGLLHKTTAQNTFLDTLQAAFEFSQGTGHIDVAVLSKFNKPFTVFAIVNHNGERIIQPYTITPNNYYEDRLKLAISTLLATNAFSLKTCEDITINQLMIKAKTIDIEGRNIDFNRFATFSDGETRFAAQSFLLDRAGNHKATTIRFLCGGPIVIGEDHDVYERHIDTKKHKEHTVIRTSVPTKIEADYAHFESLGGADIIFVGTHIKGPSEVVTGGRVHFKLGTNTYYSYRFDDDSDAMWTDKRTSVQQDTTFSECQFTHTMQIKNASKVFIEKIDKRPDIKGINAAYLHAMLDETYGTSDTVPVPEFVKQLRGINKDMMEYILAKEVHEFTETHVSAPGAALMAIVAVVTAVCTMGAGAAIAGAMMGASGALTGVAGAACSAAFSSLCVQTSMALMQNGGDPFKATKALCNSDTLKNMAIATVTAGALEYVDASILNAGSSAASTTGTATQQSAFTALAASSEATSTVAQTASLASSGVDVMQEVMTFAHQAKEAVAHAVVGATIQTAFGEKNAFKNFAQTALSSAVMRYTGGKIVGAQLEGLTEKLAHTASGAAFGYVADGEKGATSGAIGAFVAASVTSTAHEAGLEAKTAHKLGAIASALPAFWNEYNVGVGTTAGMNAASAVKDGIMSRLKAEAERQVLEQQEAQRQAAQNLKEKAAEEQAARAEEAKSQRLKQQKRKAVEQTKAYDFTGLSSAAATPSLLGSIHTEEAVSHLESQARSAKAQHVMESMKALEQETFRPRHKRSYSQEFLSLNAAVHVQANYAWQGLAAYEREGIERVSAFQYMANCGAEVPMPLFTKAPKYLAESEAERAFSAGVLVGHNHMAEHGLDGMGEAAYLGVDFCIPGGIDFGIAYANGEITRSQFVAYQSAAIAAEAATGYVAGKAVKGVARTIQRVARLTKELKTVKGIRAKSAGVLGRTHVEREATFGGANPLSKKSVTAYDFKDYVREIESVSGLQIPSEQKAYLVQMLRENKFTKIQGGDLAAHRSVYDKNRLSLIQAWENMGCDVKVREWPKYLVDGKELRAQAHHIIPQQYKGPQDWRNIHPVKVGDHQRLIHGASSELYDILKRLPKGIGES